MAADFTGLRQQGGFKGFRTEPSFAQHHSLNANLLHKWIRVHANKAMALQPAFIPLPLQRAGGLLELIHRVPASKSSTRVATSK